MQNPNNVESIDKNRSTRPCTEEGKARSSQNAVKHGPFAKIVLLPGESQEQFDALYDGLTENHKPGTATEECIVYRMAAIQWKLVRMDNLEGLAGQKASETREFDGKFLAYFTTSFFISRLQTHVTRISKSM
jgi:hypothetical protein